MNNHIKRADEFFLNGDFVSAIDQFTLAIQLAKKNGASKRVLFDVLEKRALACEKALRFPNALSDAIALTKLVPDDPAGYLRWGIVLTKIANKDYLEALEVFIRGRKLSKSPPSSAAEVARWAKLREILGDHIVKLSRKTGYTKRRDPCAVFPPEVLHQIFCQLNIRHWGALQAVSKSWRDYLQNDNHLWSSCIDFSCLKPAKHTPKLLESFLKHALVNSKSHTIRCLKIGPFSNKHMQDKCFEILTRQSSVYPNFSINELIFETSHSSVSVTHLPPVRKLALPSRPPHKAVYSLNDILLTYKDSLEELHLSIGILSFQFDGLVCPLITSISLDLYGPFKNMSSLLSVCPNLEILSLSFSLGSVNSVISQIDLSELTFTTTTTTTTTKLKSLRIVNRDNLRTLLVENTTQERLSQAWPDTLTSLSLSGLQWYFTSRIASLPDLTHLDLSNCGGARQSLEILQFGTKLETLILENNSSHPLEHFFSNNGNCANLKQLSLFNHPSANNQAVKTIIRHCPHLHTIDVGETKVSEEMIFELVENNLKLIGCQSIALSIDSYTKLSSTGCVSLKRLNL